MMSRISMIETHVSKRERLVTKISCDVVTVRDKLAAGVNKAQEAVPPVGKAKPAAGEAALRVLKNFIPLQVLSRSMYALLCSAEYQDAMLCRLLTLIPSPASITWEKQVVEVFFNLQYTKRFTALNYLGVPR